MRDYNEKNRAKKSAYMRQYRLDNLERVSASSKKWHLDNAAKSKAYILAWLVRNKDKNAANKKAYAEKNKTYLRMKKRELAARKRETDENFRIRSSLYSRLTNALRRTGVRKSISTMTLVGCDVQFLRGFLEARFKPGMTWKNYGRKSGEKYWEIDHKIPVAEFNLMEADQQRQAFHYSNLQPLWRSENRSKGAKHPGTHQPEFL